MNRSPYSHMITAKCVPQASLDRAQCMEAEIAAQAAQDALSDTKERLIDTLMRCKTRCPEVLAVRKEYIAARAAKLAVEMGR